MTDEEMAIQIGEKILSIQHELVVQKVILDQMRQPDGSPVPWREMKNWDIPQLKSTPISQEKFDELRQAIRAQSDHSSALERLYQHFLK
jgi:hypothetical protein